MIGHAHRCRVLALGGLVFLAGCGETITAAPPPAPVPRPPVVTPPTVRDDVGPVCREKVLSLQDWLKSIEEAGLPLAMSLLDEGANLVSHAGEPIRDPAPIVHLTAGRIHLDGIEVEGDQALETALTELIELRRSMMPESPFIRSPNCHLAIDKNVPWGQVVGAVNAMARGGVEALTFVFSDPNRTIPLPPASPIDGELERMAKSAPMRRGQITAEMVAYVYQDCPEGLRVIANMGVNPIADFKQAILDALPEAIGQCRCAPHDASVKALHWALFGNPRPTSAVTVALASDGDPSAVVSRPKSALWQEVQTSITSAPAGSSLRVALDPATKKSEPRTQ